MLVDCGAILAFPHKKIDFQHFSNHRFFQKYKC